MASCILNIKYILCQQRKLSVLLSSPRHISEYQERMSDMLISHK